MPPLNARDYFDGGQLKLAAAIDSDNAAAVAAALAGGGNAQAAGKEGVTPLLYAMANRKKRSVEELLRHGAEPNKRAANGENGVTIAVRLAPDDLDYLKLMLAHGGDPDTRASNNDPVLIALIAQTNTAGIKVLAAGKANLNIKDRTDTPAILAAAFAEYWDCVYTLLEAGADWKVVWGGGTTVANRADRSKLKADSPIYPFLRKTIEFLESKGVKFPPPSSAELRAQRHSP